MRAVRSSVVAVALVGALLVGCDASDSTAEPAATIDLGADLAVDGEPGELGTHGEVASDPDRIDAVVMIGDSITKGSLPALDERFGQLGMSSITIEAENGKRMAVSSTQNPSGSSLAEFVAEMSDTDHSEELWIVALGTNDIAQYDSPDEIAAAVNEVLDRVPDEAPLVWVDTYFRDRPEQQELVNSIIRDRVERRGNSVVAPWSAFAAEDGVLTGDGVHPTPGGTEVFAFVVTDTARAFLGR
jgi:lysophospholipase L1-like esterase